jgi:hypothetical protein
VPIRPENRHRYPDDWDEISAAIKQRAGWRCECTGECGRGHYTRCDRIDRSTVIVDRKPVRIVLTVAHLNHTPEDCREDNLKAMCQGCHVHYDRDHHEQTRIQREAREWEEAGQLALLETELTDPRVSSTALTDGRCAA